MTAVLLSPHNDDAEIFAAFTLLGERPHVVVVLRSFVQERRGYGITWQEREAETAAAMEILGCSWEQWEYPDDRPPWDEIGRRILDLDAEQLFAPYPEGHDHHVEVSRLAEQAFLDRPYLHPTKLTLPLRFYATYTADGRSEQGVRVPVREPEWTELKLRALLCYRSQMRHWTTYEHFLREQWEYLV